MTKPLAFSDYFTPAFLEQLVQELKDGRRQFLQRPVEVLIAAPESANFLAQVVREFETRGVDARKLSQAVRGMVDAQESPFLKQAVAESDVGSPTNFNEFMRQLVAVIPLRQLARRCL